MSLKLKYNHSYKITYKLNNRWEALINLLLKRARLITLDQLKSINPLLILDLRQIPNQTYHTLILDHHDQVWISQENIRYLTEFYFNQLAYPYHLWQSFIRASSPFFPTDIPYVYGKHHFIKFQTQARNGYHWLNLTHLEKLDFKQQRIHIEIKGSGLNPPYYQFVITDINKRIQKQLYIGFKLQEKFLAYLNKNEVNSSTINHLCINKFDLSPNYKVSVGFKISKKAIQSFLELNKLLQANQINLFNQKQLLNKFIMQNGYYAKKQQTGLVNYKIN